MNRFGWTFFTHLRRECVRLPKDRNNKLFRIRALSMARDEENITQTDWIRKLHEQTLGGNVVEVQKMIEGYSAENINRPNPEGRTALMVAAENGRKNLVKLFLELGCNAVTANKAGQTALTLALSSQHNDIADMILHHNKTGSTSSIFFCASPLDRAAKRRTDSAWLQETMKRETTKFMVIRDGSVLVQDVKDDRGKSRFHIATLKYEDIHILLNAGIQSVFLGLEKGRTDVRPAWFCLGISDDIEESAFTGYVEGSEFLPLFPGLLQVRDGDASVCAQAYSIINWNSKNKFCTVCGSKTYFTDAGYKRKCENKECETLKGIHNTSYPRVDPSIIVLVLSPDGEKCLLGRQKRFPLGMWSCLAGFVEAGESIEDACYREMEEEGGIPISRIEYHSSQPWPYPSTLMIGCVAHSHTEVLKVDHDELEGARWFTKEEIGQMFAHKHKDQYFVPPRQALAHQLLKSWMMKSKL